MNSYRIYDLDHEKYWSAVSGYVDLKEAGVFPEDHAHRILQRNQRLEKVSEWTYVESYKDVPEGIWLVKIETSREEMNPHQVIEVHPNVSIIGHHFAFDERRVIAYKPLGELL